MRPSSEPIVQVWVARSADYADTAGLAACLDEHEWARAQKFLRPEDQADFIVAHALKRKHIAARLKISDPARLRFAADHTGKPYSLDADIHFNLSHSHGLCALAISDTAPCAVDIEAHRHIEQLPLLIRKTMTTREQAQIGAAPSRHKAFMDRWVLKEAFLKLSGAGLAVEPASICTAHEILGARHGFGTLRGAPLFFRRGQSYSLAASGEKAAEFVFARAGGHAGLM